MASESFAYHLRACGIGGFCHIRNPTHDLQRLDEYLDSRREHTGVVFDRHSFPNFSPASFLCSCRSGKFAADSLAHCSLLQGRSGRKRLVLETRRSANCGDVIAREGAASKP